MGSTEFDQCRLRIFGVALTLDAVAESIREHGLTSGLVGNTRLASTEITRLFAVVFDRGEVQNHRGISAETHWRAGGIFVSLWWTVDNPVSDAIDANDYIIEMR